MKRADYMASLAAHKVDTSLQSRFAILASTLNQQLEDLDVHVELYDSETGFQFKIVHAKSGRTAIEGLNPAYANSSDYRQIATYANWVEREYTCASCNL